MKKYSNWLPVLTTIIILALVVFLPSILHAQDPASPPDSPPDGGLGDPDAPIDGGLAFLLVAGAVYGVKKVRDMRKQKQAAEIA